MNTTGRVTAESVILERADWAAERDRLIILDRAYPGFEFAGLFETVGYDAVMRMSYERQTGAVCRSRNTPVDRPQPDKVLSKLRAATGGSSAGVLSRPRETKGGNRERECVDAGARLFIRASCPLAPSLKRCYTIFSFLKMTMQPF